MNYKFNNQVALVLCTLLASVGCGDKKEKKPAPPTAEAIRAQINEKSPEGNGFKISYTSNVEDASFKCQTQPQGTAAGEWESCDADGMLVTGQPGQRITFRVKAVSPAGVESEAATVSVTMPMGMGMPVGNQPNQPNQPPRTPPGTNTNREQEPNLNMNAGSTVILSKEQLQKPVEQSTVTLNFGVREGRGPVEQYKFECQIDDDSEWKACSGEAEHTLTNLEDGKNYTLKVRAVYKGDKAVAAEDSVTFAVKRQQLTINGEQTLRDTKTGKVRLSFDQAQVAGRNIQCQVNDQPPVNCVTGHEVNISALSQGQHRLTITAGELSPVVIPFCAVSCEGGPQQPVMPPPPKEILVGNTVTLRVPETMHVTTYGTTQTTTTRLNFIQVMNDPYFVGNYNCNGTPMDRPFADGNLQYCNVTPNGALFNWLTDNTVSLNHVEIATDQVIVDNNPMEHDRLIINQFDSEYEFQYVRSRFGYLCRNVQQTITVTEPILLANTFWRSPGLPARFVSCYGPIANTGNGLWHDPGMFQGWWIGTFFITKDQNALPTAPCLKGYNPFSIGVPVGEYVGCAGYTQPQLVEVTVMTRRQFAQPVQFARWAQELTLNSISQFMPFY